MKQLDLFAVEYRFDRGFWLLSWVYWNDKRTLIDLGLLAFDVTIYAVRSNGCERNG